MKFILLKAATPVLVWLANWAYSALEDVTADVARTRATLISADAESGVQVASA